eukprot:5017357-Amphidinium_carterae.1
MKAVRGEANKLITTLVKNQNGSSNSNSNHKTIINEIVGAFDSKLEPFTGIYAAALKELIDESF